MDAPEGGETHPSWVISCWKSHAVMNTQCPIPAPVSLQLHTSAELNLEGATEAAKKPPAPLFLEKTRPRAHPPPGGGRGFSVLGDTYPLCVSYCSRKHLPQTRFLKSLPQSQMRVLFILELARFVAAGQHVYNESRGKTKFIVTHELHDLGQVSSAPPQ